MVVVEEGEGDEDGVGECEQGEDELAAAHGHGHAVERWTMIARGHERDAHDEAGPSTVSMSVGCTRARSGAAFMPLEGGGWTLEAPFETRITSEATAAVMPSQNDEKQASTESVWRPPRCLYPQRAPTIFPSHQDKLHAAHLSAYTFSPSAPIPMGTSP